MSRYVSRGRTALAFAALLPLISASIDKAKADDWTQLYVGASGGVDAIVSDISGDAGGAGFEANGLGGGDLGLTLRVGGDYQVNSWFVIGAFAQYDWSNIDTQAAFSFGADTLRAEILRLEKAWAVGGRAGFLFTPRVLAYGLIGYTEVTFGDMSINGAGLDVSAELPKDRGVMTGVGFEHRLTPTLSFTGEYRASFLEEKSLANVLGVPIKAEGTMHAARLGLALRFGDIGPAASVEEPITAAAAPVWTGLYGGVGLGADAIVGDLAMTAPALGLAAATTGLGGGNIGGSATIGYDHAFATKFIIGPFFTYDKSAQDIEFKASAAGESASVNIPSIDYMMTGGVRAGVLASDDTLLYALIGYTRMEFTDLEASSSIGLSAKVKSDSYDGISFGGGVEKLIGHGLSLRAEYRFVDLGSENIDSVPGVYTVRAEPDLHIGRLMLNYRP